MRALFFPQNETHINNMVPVAEILQNTGIEIVFLDTRNIYKQNLEFDPRFSLDAMELDFCLEKSFYRMSAKDRVIFIALHKNKIMHLADQFDFFIFGNDGALQRIMINYAKKAKKSTFIILDGIITYYSYNFLDIIQNKPNNLLRSILVLVKNFIKHSISDIAKQLPLNCNCYLPSHVGSTKVDAVFVIGEHSRLALEKTCSQRESYAYGLPQMSRLFKSNYNRATHNTDNPSGIRMLFLPGAYKWHGLFDLGEAQHKDIALLCDVINKYNTDQKNEHYKIQLFIKLHPREERQDYDLYSSCDFIEIVENGNLDDIILDSDVIFSHLSTTIIESILLEKPVYSITINFPYWKFKNSFIGNKAIKKIFSKTQLMKVVEEYCQPMPKRRIKVPNEIYELISPITPMSAVMIGKKIISILDQKS